MRALVALAVLWATACADSASDGSARDAGTPTVEQCERTPTEPYTMGIDHASADGRFHVRILDAMPAPPAVGDNTWTIQLVDAGGMPLTGAAPSVTATNPGRNLPSSRTPRVSVVDAGRAIYRVEGLLLGVVGIWRIAIGNGPDAGAGEAASFDFCVSG